MRKMALVTEPEPHVSSLTVREGRQTSKREGLVLPF